MNPVYSDAEILDRAEAHIKTTMGFLKSRILMDYADLQTVGRGTACELASKDCDAYTETLIDELVTHWRLKLPDMAEYRADQVAADRALAHAAE